MARETIVCSNATYTELGSTSFDEAGKAVISLPNFPPQAIAPNSVHDFISRVMCKGVQLPQSNMINGHANALLMARALLRSQREGSQKPAPRP